jgi:AraC-like DNA-binding protein
MLREATQVAVLSPAVAQVAVPHQAEPLRGDIDGIVTGARLGGVCLGYVRWGKPTRVVTQPTGDVVAWTAPLGPMHLERAGRRTGQRSGFVVDRDAPTRMLPNPVRGNVVLRTTQDRLARHLRDVTGHPAPPDFDILAGSGRPEAAGVIDAAWRFAAGMLRTDQALPAISTSLEEAILNAMLLELPCTLRPEQLTQRGGPTRPDAARATEWAEAHLAEPLTVTSWAAAVGISVRQLQKVLREVHGCTPVEYLTSRRLLLARTLLRSGELTVTEAATRAGFAHLGRFAAAYRARFGVNPSEALPRPPG